MKKILSLIIATVILALCFASCSNGNTNEGTLSMATNANFPPYEFKDGENYAGIDVEIAGLIAEKLGLKLEIHDIEFGSIIAGVQSGKFDMGMAGMTITDERKKSVNFSDTYSTSEQSVIVKEDSIYKSFEEFYTGFDKDGNPNGVKDGIKIGVQQDTTGDIYSSSEPNEWGFSDKNVVRYKSGAEAVQALASGKVTAVIIDNQPANEYVKSTKGLKILEGAYTEEEYAICVSKDNDELLGKINNALKQLKSEGKISEIINKYIK